MRLLEGPLFSGRVAATAITALLLAGCNDSSPTEPKRGATPPVTFAPTPTPAWTGNYNGISARCDSSAQASFGQAGSKVDGTMTVPCLNGQYQFQFFGDLQGNSFTGLALWGDPEFYPLKGTFSGSSLEITIFDETGATPMGQLHLHR